MERVKWRQKEVDRLNIISIFSIVALNISCHRSNCYPASATSDISVWLQRQSNRFVMPPADYISFYQSSVCRIITVYKSVIPVEVRKPQRCWVMTQNLSAAVRPSELKTCFSLSESSLSCLHSPLHIFSSILWTDFKSWCLDIGFFPLQFWKRCILAQLFRSNIFCYQFFDFSHHAKLYKWVIVKR